MKKNLVAIMLIATVAISIAMGAFYQYGRSLWYPVVSKYMGKQTVAEVIAQYSDQTKDNLAPLFAAQGIVYPPKNLALLAFKDTALLEVWAANADEEFKKITEYPVLAASGKLGPKLREGDKQVPEGIYNIAGFNPNSAYHLSMQVNYPNDFDLQHAKSEGAIVRVPIFLSTGVAPLWAAWPWATRPLKTYLPWFMKPVSLTPKC